MDRMKTFEDYLNSAAEAQKWCLGIGNSSEYLNNIGQGETLAQIIQSNNQNQPGAQMATGKNNQEKTWNYFKALGFTPQSIAGIMGNLMQESTPNIDPTLKQGGGGPGRGIMQWTYSQRWQSLLKYAASHNMDPNDLATQLNYMVQEMKTYKSGGQAVYDKIKVMTNIESATYFFEETMERAGKPMMERRIAYAKQVYNLFAGK